MSTTNLLTFYEELFKQNDLQETFNNNLKLKSHIIELSELFALKTKSNNNDNVSNTNNASTCNTQIDEILAMRKYKILINEENYLLKYFLKNHFSINEILTTPNLENKLETEITDIEIKDFILNDFYTCLRENNLNDNPRLSKFSANELIGTVCVKERLTYYNYLVEKTTISKSDIKKYINKKYFEVILKRGDLPNVEYDKKPLGELFSVYTI